MKHLNFANYLLFLFTLFCGYKFIIPDKSILFVFNELLPVVQELDSYIYKK